jgi:hypothetical protein
MRIVCSYIDSIHHMKRSAVTPVRQSIIPIIPTHRHIYAQSNQLRLAGPKCSYDVVQILRHLGVPNEVTMANGGKGFRRGVPPCRQRVAQGIQCRREFYCNLGDRNGRRTSQVAETGKKWGTVAQASEDGNEEVE